MTIANGPNPEASDRPFTTVLEPAVGAGAMLLAAAEHIPHPQRHLKLYAEAWDLSLLAYRMAYIQLSLAGIPALVIQGNTLSYTVYDAAWTPAVHPFAAAYGIETLASYLPQPVREHFRAARQATAA